MVFCGRFFIQAHLEQHTTHFKHKRDNCDEGKLARGALVWGRALLSVCLLRLLPLWRNLLGRNYSDYDYRNEMLKRPHMLPSLSSVSPNLGKPETATYNTWLCRSTTGATDEAFEGKKRVAFESCKHSSRKSKF